MYYMRQGVLRQLRLEEGEKTTNTPPEDNAKHDTDTCTVCLKYDNHVINVDRSLIIT